MKKITWNREEIHDEGCLEFISYTHKEDDITIGVFGSRGSWNVYIDSPKKSHDDNRTFRSLKRAKDVAIKSYSKFIQEI